MKKTFVLGFLTVIFAVVIAALNPDQVQAKMSIPEDAFEYNGHMYYYYKDAVTWEEAKTACKKLGGHLVVFSDKDEENAIWEYINKKQAEVWMGLYNTELPDRVYMKMVDYTWKSVTGEKVKYENWSEVQPDGLYHFFTDTFDMYATFGDGESVSEFKDSATPSWGDRDSEYKTGYVCEWDIYDIVIDYAPKKLKKGKSGTITYTVFDKAGYNKVKKATATFKTSNKKIAKVSKTGKVTAVKKGKCSITLTYKGCTKKVKITVS